jgi:hemerythrin-like domain-containing protein
MKRHPQLQDLSREHHGALKLARAARQAAESGKAGNVAALARRVVERFAAELDPHFCVEESGILVALARAGETTLVQRTLKEHAELRALAGAFSSAEATESTEAAMLSRFADLLASHVRFEERELFEAAQSLMAAA